MKKERQTALLELIRTENIETQDELQDKLEALGFNVTQATVSRDIKELRIVKILNDNGVYCYSVHSAGGSNDNKEIKIFEIFSHSVISVNYALNDVVIKCHQGLAQGACAALDKMGFDDKIIGTLAGDDTILAITASESDAVFIAEKISSMIG